jgi:hypothetical protein
LALATAFWEFDGCPSGLDIFFMMNTSSTNQGAIHSVQCSSRVMPSYLCGCHVVEVETCRVLWHAASSQPCAEAERRPVDDALHHCQRQAQTRFGRNNPNAAPPQSRTLRTHSGMASAVCHHFKPTFTPSDRFTGVAAAGHIVWRLFSPSFWRCFRAKTTAGPA